jgi:predicted metal-dependent RNase
MKKQEKNNIRVALLKAIFITRWNEEYKMSINVLEPNEVEDILENIFIELDKIGYEIKKKQ